MTDTTATIRQLSPTDAAEVSELAVRSKAAWNYPANQMAVFREELTLSGKEIMDRIAFGASLNGSLAGYYTVAVNTNRNAELEHLFVDPMHMRQGIGTALLKHALVQCQQNGIRELTVLSDPHAAGFYESHEAEFINDIPSSIPGRSIPKYRFEIVSRAFLEPTETIDWEAKPIQLLAADLKQQSDDEPDLAKRTFEWVRDGVEHSLDFNRTVVTWRASDVLANRTGFCYAKSHLLAALLRANGIPAGFCYQRLKVTDAESGWCLHGLNAVFLPDIGWYRVDPRGNKPGVNCQFKPPVQQLAFRVAMAGECDYLEIWSDPLPVVLRSLQSAASLQELAACLPDLSPSEMQEVRDTAAKTGLTKQQYRWG
jgi:N-acetylglutamate synthase-like GNAT family acetyltransferase